MTTARTPKKKTPAQEELWDGKRDPEMYARLSRPFPTQEAAEVAASRFTAALYDLRVEHGIADVSVILAVPHQAKGEVLSVISSTHFGDASLQFPLVSKTFRALQGREHARIAKMGQPDGAPPQRSTETGDLVRRLISYLRQELQAIEPAPAGGAPSQPPAEPDIEPSVGDEPPGATP